MSKKDNRRQLSTIVQLWFVATPSGYSNSLVSPKNLLSLQRDMNIIIHLWKKTEKFENSDLQIQHYSTIIIVNAKYTYITILKDYVHYVKPL